MCGQKMDGNSYIRYQNYGWNDNQLGGYPTPDEVKDSIQGAIIGPNSEIAWVDLYETRTNRIHRLSTKSPIMYPITGPIQLLQSSSGDQFSAGLLEVIFFVNALPNNLPVGRAPITLDYTVPTTVSVAFQYPKKFPARSSPTDKLPEYISSAFFPTILCQGRKVVNVSVLNGNAGTLDFDIFGLYYRTSYGVAPLGPMNILLQHSSQGAGQLVVYTFTDLTSMPDLLYIKNWNAAGGFTSAEVLFEAQD